MSVPEKLELKEFCTSVTVSFFLVSSADQPASVLVTATSSDSDTEDEALQSNNSRYDNHTPPCTGNQHTHHEMRQSQGA